MIKVGITGGIGSGKSTVAKIFSSLGIPVFDADKVAKEILLRDTIKKEIIKNFGTESYQNEMLNRAHIAAIVFNDKEKLALLNSITHPATIKEAHEWFAKQSAPYAIKEAALIFESGSQKNLDYVIGVFADEKTRTQRVMMRDNITEAQVKERISKQMNEEEKMKLCDFIIMNDESKSIIQQVWELDAILRNKV